MAQEIKPTAPSANQPAQHRDPFAQMRAEMDRVFDSFLGNRWSGLPSMLGTEPRERMVVPSIDVRENASEIVIEAELPGLEEKDVDVTLRDGILTIKGNKKSEAERTEDDVHITERSFGSFQRSLRVPDSVDEEHIKAKLEKGVLHVALPKRPEAVRSEKKIPIGGN